MGELKSAKDRPGSTPRVLVVGSCIYDVLFFVDHLPMRGESLIASFTKRRLGGKGFNQAVSLARLGCDVTFVGGLGEDEFARLFHELAEREGMHFRPETIFSAATGMAAPMITPDGVSSIVVDPGAAMHLGTMHLQNVLDEGPWDAVLCHYEVPTDCLCVLFDQCEASGFRVVCNPAPWMGDRALEFARRANVVILNTVEAGRLAGESGITVSASLPELARSCADVCNGQLLVLTLGEDGSVAVHGGEIISYAAFSVDVVDSTGAGDAFCAGLIYGLVHDWSLRRMLALASGTAALACTSPGGAESMPRLEQAIKLAFA